MGDLKKFDIEQLESSIQSMERAMSEFSSYDKNYLEEVMVSLEGFNSDFVESLKKVLNNMKDTQAPNLQKSLKSYVQEIKTIKKEFKELDEQQAKSIGGK